MKVVVNTRLLVPEKMDGIARFTYETLQIITKEHPEVEFTFVFDRKVSKASFNFPKNVQFVSIGPPARLPILWYIWFEIKLKNYINKNAFDLFLSPEGWVPPKLTCKSLAVIHDLNFEHHPENIIWSHRKYLLHFFPKFAQRATHIATVSEYSKQDISTCYGIDHKNIDVVYNGANSIFQPAAKKDIQKFKETCTKGCDYFIFIGTLHPRKNLENLFLAFDAFKTKNNNEIKLLIVGNKKWWPDELEEIYQSLTHGKEIIFLGRLSDLKLSEALSGAISLAYTPHFEGFGIPILEAFQTKTPVITSNVTSMPEVADGAALLADPKNVKQIAQAMQTVSSDSQKREEMIKKGVIRAQDFSWEKSAQLLWASMQKALKK